MLHQKPDKKLVRKIAKAIGDEEADRADMRPIPGAMIAKADPAMHNIPDARKYDVHQCHRYQGVDMQQICHRPIATRDQSGKRKPNDAKAHNLPEQALLFVGYWRAHRRFSCPFRASL